ncbi:MAG: citramalate synthase [Clostridia bacterium]|nr:citramalate synthase [Clostridia bacterium]
MKPEKQTKTVIYDATLREGEQRAGVVFSEYEKLKIISGLDSLGVDYIEVGFLSASNAERLIGLCEEAKSGEKGGARLSVLCAARRPGCRAEDDPALRLLAASGVPAAAVVGKASSGQVTSVLGTSLEENLAMIADTVSFLKKAGKTVFFDAEHFFDGFAEDPGYAREVLNAARDADAVVLCDTNGATLPDEIAKTVSLIAAENGGGPRLGIHCHNDIGMADASTVAAVLAGAGHVQLTVSGIGERCGNADLTTVIPVLQLKLGIRCLSDGGLAVLSPIARKICQTANLAFDESAPFVGAYAFSHKAGMHIDALLKNSQSFEHIDPRLVGNSRSLVLSELSGRAAVAEMLSRYGYRLAKGDPSIDMVLERMREEEKAGMQFDNSDASLRLLAGRVLGGISRPLEILDYKLIFSAGEASGQCWSAVVKFAVGGEPELSAGEGDGPVNALDVAAHRALSRVFPEIERVKMLDIKARIDANDSMASASTVRVFVESGDGDAVWHTMGASTDIIAASWRALLDSYEYYVNFVLG